jgi:uncharacterized iron-regulated protein
VRSPTSALLLPVAAVLAVAACLGRGAPATRSPTGEAWASPLQRSHPLAGRVYDVRAGAFAEWSALEAAAVQADFLLLGETHDNEDHHRLQARVLRAVTAAGKKPAVAFEMLDAGQQEAVDAALKASPHDPEAVADAVKWDKGGWPPFEIYRPVFAAALDAGLPLVAVNLTRAQARDMVRRGAEALDPEVASLLERAGPLSAGALASLKREMAESHCGELPDRMLEPMVVMQRARDAKMAQRTAAAAARQGGGVLVAGTGHARKDRGVPAFLALEAPGRPVVSIAFVEAFPEGREPADYAKELGVAALPFDWVVFTARAEREDPCEGLRERVRGAHDGGKPPGSWLGDGGRPDAAHPATTEEKETSL